MSESKTYYVVCATADDFRRFLQFAAKQIENFDIRRCYRLSRERDFHGVDFSLVSVELAIVQGWNRGEGVSGVEWEEAVHQATLNYRLFKQRDAKVYDL